MAASTAVGGPQVDVARPKVDLVNAPGTATASKHAELAQFERELLGDLFAIVEEHADQAALPIDHDRVEEAFVYA